jgi:hypothetical protein
MTVQPFPKGEPMRGFLIAVSRTAALSLLLGAPAVAGTLHCQSVNGNLNCAGSGAVSCQTVNGRTTCTNGEGDVVQSFGGSADDPAIPTPDAPEDDDATPPRGWRPPALRYGLPNHTLLLQRDGLNLHLRTDRLSIDRTWSAQ